MARRLRIEICGYHHVYNRGVAKNNIFLNNQDKEKFLEVLGDVAKEFKFNIHSFCLMDNHYHLLIENQKENLSDGMRQLNSKYASYFNRKHDRVGHLWQDRFKSWFVMSDEYLFTLFKYIESNPVKAKMTKKIGEYKYSATYSILNDGVPLFLKNSFVLRDYNTAELFETLSIPFAENEMHKIDKFHKIVFKMNRDEIVQTKKLELKEYFRHIDTKSDRNSAINKAFKDDYSKSEISREIGLSVTGVSNIIQKFKIEGWPLLLSKVNFSKIRKIKLRG